MFFIFSLFSSRCSHYSPHTHHQPSQHARYCIPPLLSLSATMWVPLCVSLHACSIRGLRKEKTTACTYSKERLWMASFHQIVLLIGDNEDRSYRPVRDTCHSLSHSHLRKFRLFFAALLSYQHLQRHLNHLIHLIHHITIAFTSPLQKSVTFGLCKVAKHQ